MLARCTRRAAASLWLLAVALGAAAQDEALPAGPPIALGDALARTLAANPDLVAAGFETMAAAGRLQQAGLRPNPELAATLQDVLGSGPYRSFDSAESTVTIGWLFERGVREHIVDAARADLMLRNVDVGIVRVDAAAETARRFIVCLAFQRRLANANVAVGLAQDTVRLIRERVRAGRTLEAELARAEAELARTELTREDYEHELLTAYHRLSAQWGDTTPDFGSANGDVQTLPALEPLETLLARVEASPELMRFGTRERADDAELQLAEARSRPGWHVSAGLRHYATTGDLGVVGGFTAPLPIRNRNQGQIAEARARVAQTKAEQTATRVHLETELFGLYQELKHNLQLAGRLTADVIPRLERALADTRRAYELGRYGYSEWRLVQVELLDANNELLEASVDAHRIVIEIERLTGMPIAPAPTTP